MRAWVLCYCWVLGLIWPAWSQEIEIGMRLRTETVFPPFSTELAEQAWGFNTWQRVLEETGVLHISQNNDSRYWGIVKVQELAGWHCLMASQPSEPELGAWLIEVKLRFLVLDVAAQRVVAHDTVYGHAVTSGSPVLELSALRQLLRNAFIEACRCAAAALVPKFTTTPPVLPATKLLLLDRKQRELAKLADTTGRKPLNRSKRDWTKEWERLRVPSLIEQYREFWPSPPTGQELPVTLALVRPVVTVDDAIGLTFTAGANGYVYLINLPTQGPTQLLLPLVGYNRQPQNRVRAGDVRVYPIDEPIFPFAASDFVAQKPGAELFLLLLTPRPLPALEAAVKRAWDLAETKQAKGEDYDNLVPLTTGDLDTARDQIKHGGRWGWTAVELTVREK